MTRTRSCRVYPDPALNQYTVSTSPVTSPHKAITCHAIYKRVHDWTLDTDKDNNVLSTQLVMFQK